jgi:hypothetical protein
VRWIYDHLERIALRFLIIIEERILKSGLGGVSSWEQQRCRRVAVGRCRRHAPVQSGAVQVVDLLGDGIEEEVRRRDLGPLGRCQRIVWFVFSLVPRSHGEDGRAKDPYVPAAAGTF